MSAVTVSAIAHQAPIAADVDGARDGVRDGVVDGSLDCRAHLVLVPTGDDAVRAARAARVAWDIQSPLRLTRLGRLVVALLIAVAVAVLGVGLAGQLASAGSAPRSLTVVSGDTLSGIAARELPSLPIADGIVEIQLANSLSSDHVQAGQTLVIPTP